MPSSSDDMKIPRSSEIRPLLSGGDRRSIADSNRVRILIENDPSLVGELAVLTADEDWLVTQRALDLLEKLAHEHPDWIAPHKKIFIGPLGSSDKWEIRLQIVRALPLFHWSPAQTRRVEALLLENLAFPQTFVRAWALDSLATLAEQRVALMPIVRKHLRDFEQSPSKALQARARQIRARLTGPAGPRKQPRMNAARQAFQKPVSETPKRKR
jgi:HEAT repeat protein